MANGNPHIGSLFNDWLAEQGLQEDAYNHAVKRVLARQIEQEIKAQGIAHLDRLLDPENDKVRLDTVQRAAAVGRKLRLELA